MKVEAVRSDGVLLVTHGGRAAAIVSDDGTWLTTRESAFARGNWDRPGSEDVIPFLARENLASELSNLDTELGAPIEFPDVSTGSNTSITVTAGAEMHTGAMIALVPTESDAQRIAVDGGEDAEQLHVTICYLGEGALIPPETREQIIDCVSECAARLPTIIGNVFAISVFNPLIAGADGGDPCVTALVSGSLLQRAHSVLAGDVYDTLDVAGVAYPTPHSPWIPHITLLYTDDADAGAFVDKVGPVTFDRVRVAFAGDVYDIPLGDHGGENGGMLTPSYDGGDEE
jgi:2'-5' RNA ligase